MIIYNGKSSYTDFDLYVAAKEIPAPQRKVITETVPYMSGVWDFSYHDNGVDEYEALKLKYSFDVIADTKRELSEQKAALNAWLHGKTDGKLYDTDISLTKYYKVYHAQASWSENDLQGLLTVEFLCYPFMLTDKTITQALTATAQSVTVENEGERAIMPTIRVASKNLFDISKIKPTSYANVSVSKIDTNSITITTTEEHTGVGWCGLIDVTLATLCPSLRVGDVCVLSFVKSGGNNYIHLGGVDEVWYNGGEKTITSEMLNSNVAVYGFNALEKGDYGECVMSNVQIELGETATEYTPYVASPTATINNGANSYALSAGSYSGLLTLEKGANTITAKGEGLLRIEYAEEAF